MWKAGIFSNPEIPEASSDARLKALETGDGHDFTLDTELSGYSLLVVLEPSHCHLSLLGEF